MSEQTGGGHTSHRPDTVPPPVPTDIPTADPTCPLAACTPFPLQGLRSLTFGPGNVIMMQRIQPSSSDVEICMIQRSVHLRPSQAVPGKMDSGSDPERCSECSDVDDDGESSDADDDDEGSVSDASSSGGSDPSASGSTDTGSGSDDSNEATAEQCSEPNLSSECEEVGEVEAEHKEHCTLGAINCPHCR